MKKILSLCLLFILLIVSANDLSARAGGGGGRKSSSSRSSSSSSHSFSSSRSHGSGRSGNLPMPIIFGIIGVIVLVIVIKAITNKNKKNTLESGTNNNRQIVDQSKGSAPVIGEAFLAANPGFSKDAFKEKVKTGFMAIQDAWMRKDLSKVRKWISDGVYQRFNLQFEMMKKLEQTNKLSNIEIQRVQFVKAYTEGEFSVITVAVSFKMDDEFISNKIKKLNEKYMGDEAIEVWTFVKRSGKIEKDLYSSDSCPNCGNALGTDGGEVSKCPSCDTVTYLGDYDWVLSEITQEDDFNADNNTLPKDQGLLDLMGVEGVCVQNMEDKASNAFVHYLFANAWNDTKPFNRFATDEVLNELKTNFKEPFVFNRVYINRVTCKRFDQEEGMNRFHFSIKYTGQRVKLSGNDVQFLDSDIETYGCNFTLSKKANVGASKSKLWSHDCPNCGAPHKDTTSTTCSYCSAKINTTDQDWVVTGITS